MNVAHALTQSLFVKDMVRKFAWTRMSTCAMDTEIAITTLTSCQVTAMDAHRANFLSVKKMVKIFAEQTD